MILKRIVLWSSVVLVVLLALGAWGVWEVAEHWPPHGVLHVDGDAVSFGPLSPGHWLLGAFAIAIALLIAVIVVPLTLCAIVATIAGVFGLAALAVVGTGAVLLAPFALVAALVWWLVRPKRASTTVAPPAGASGPGPHVA